MDYATHQYRLMPLLALTYAMHFGGVQTNKIFTECSEQLEVRGSPHTADVVGMFVIPYRYSHVPRPCTFALGLCVHVYMCVCAL
jgi:hypothetical protein